MPCVLRLSQFKDNAIQQQAMVALSLLGYVKPPKGRGVRVLCLDGGGTRWVNETTLRLSNDPSFPTFSHVFAQS